MRVYHLRYFMALLFLAFFFKANCQTGKEKTLVNLDGDTISIVPIALSEITTNIDIAYEKLKDIENNLQPSRDLLQFDSLYNMALIGLDSLKTVLFNREDFALKEINDELQKWDSYSNILDSWKEKINSKLKILDQNQFDIKLLDETWNLTIENARKEGISSNVITNVTDLSTQIEEFNEVVSSNTKELLRKQNKITELRLIVDEVITYLKDARSSLQADYLRQDRPPIWYAADSTASLKNIKLQFTKAFEQNKEYLSNFYETNNILLIVQLLIFMALWFSIFVLHRHTNQLIDEENRLKFEKSLLVVSKHGISALIITLVLSIWIYQHLVSIVNDIIQLIYIIIAIYFLPLYYGKRIKPILYLLLFLYFLNEIQIFFYGKVFWARIDLLAESLLAAWILFKLNSRKGFIYESLANSNWAFLLKLIPILIFAMIISAVSNIVGMVDLALLLNSTIVNAIINLLIVVLVIIVFNRLTFIILRTKYIQKSNTIKNNLGIIEKYTYGFIQILSFLLWSRSILRLLGVQEFLREWFIGVIQTSWKVGNTTIDIGGIISFILVIVFTYYFLRFVKTILKNEIYPKVKLPRGVPGAITMIAGYIIVGYGIYIALGAAGVDFSQFGLIAGALGVGIGFGLQGIVANFIAGIVLAFERPIQVGDTIQIGEMYGDVLQIGVRSTTIKTYDGSEVIIPNSNLITNDVINWTLSDRRKRRDIYVGVAYGSEPEKVMEIMKKVANEHPEVQNIPAPWALFDGFGDSALNFRLRIWTTMDTGMTTKSDVTMAIYDELQKAGIEIPFPQRDLHIKTLNESVELNKGTNIKESRTKSNKNQPNQKSNEPKKPE